MSSSIFFPSSLAFAMMTAFAIPSAATPSHAFVIAQSEQGQMQQGEDPKQNELNKDQEKTQENQTEQPPKKEEKSLPPAGGQPSSAVQEEKTKPTSEGEVPPQMGMEKKHLDQGTLEDGVRTEKGQRHRGMRSLSSDVQGETSGAQKEIKPALEIKETPNQPTEKREQTEGHGKNWKQMRGTAPQEDLSAAPEKKPEALENSGKKETNRSGGFFDQLRNNRKERPADHEETNRDEGGFAKFRNNRKESPAVDLEKPASMLSDSELRQRIDSLSQGGQKNPLAEQQLNRDRAELKKRIEENSGQKIEADLLGNPSLVDQKADEFLKDSRNPEDLNDAALRARMDKTRSLLALSQLSPKTRSRLQERLQEDRDALRGRIAQKRFGTSSDEGQDWQYKEKRGGGGRVDAGDIAQLLEDSRSSRELSPRELERRIRRIDRALFSSDLNPRDRRELEGMRASDRRALRDRLSQERRERRGEDRMRPIVIIEDAPYAPRAPIYADEVDDSDLEEQLIAPPTRRIDRRYRVEDLRRMPSLRNVMPGVEIDSIHFEFNQAILREEEIDNLSRVGQIIERILNKNPDEVFLIEGHTDAVGSYRSNLQLSLKRAQAVKKALLQYFEIGSRNLEVVGYGARFPKIPTLDEEPENRRVTIRRITPLLHR